MSSNCKIFKLKIFHKKNFRVKQIFWSHMGGLGKFLTHWQKATSFEHAAQEFDHMRDLHNMEEFGSDCCTQGYPVHKELLEKCWSV